MPPLERNELISALMKEIDQQADPDLYNDTRQAFESASNDQLYGWYNQQNDPGQARENAWSSGVEAAQRDLSQNSFPEMSAEAKNEIAKQLSNDMNSLERTLTQEQSLTRKHEQEIEQ